MKRNAPPKQAAGIALFPFLAVLLCTMGALLVLLVALARNSAEQAKLTAQSSEQVDADFVAAREHLQWRREQLRAARDKTLSQLTDQRSVLSHFEEHARRMRDEIEQMEKAANDMVRSSESDGDTNRKLRDRIARYDKDIEAMKSDVEQVKRETKGRKDSYAIIPYDGPNQTRRRPIYIECRSDAIILQPEGIVLDETDFMGPSGPSNPLAASLRAAREYMMRSIDPSKDPDAEPYPLLLVRPDGIPFYYMARAAMAGWGNDFGYELIEQDWKVQYQPANLSLAAAMSRAVDEARKRQEMLASAAPRLMSSDEREAFRSAVASRSSGGGGGHRTGGMGHPSGGTAGGSPSGGKPGLPTMASRAGSRYANFDEQQAQASAAALAPYAGMDLTGSNGPGGAGPGGTSPFAGQGGFGGGPAGQPGFGQSGVGQPGGLGAGGTAGDPLGKAGGAWGVPGTGGAGSPQGLAGGLPSNGSLAGGPAGPGGNGMGGSPYGDVYGGSAANGSSTGGTAGGTGNSSIPGGKPGQTGGIAGGQQGPSLGAPGGTQAGSPGSAGSGGASGGASPGSGAQGGTSGAGGGGSGTTSGGQAGGAAGMASTGGTQQQAGSGALSMNLSDPSKSSQQPSGDPSETGNAGGTAAAQEKQRSAFETAGKAYATPKRRVSADDTQGDPGGSQASGASTPPTPPKPGATLSKEQREQIKKRAKSKHRNWAMQEESRSSISITRPIQLECRADQLVLLSERGDYPRQQSIPFGADTSQAVEPLVGAVWERINSWGIAGDGMHWKPVLVVQVAPDGTSRYEDLLASLANSGLEMKMKGAQSRTVQAPDSKKR